jgi:quercetin dioxygenase-like cupin family protein
MPLIDYNSKNKVKIWDGIYGQVHHSNGMTVARIIISKGVALPEHFHIHEQWSNMLKGEMEFVVGGEKHILKAGQTVLIPSNVPHSGMTLTDCELIDIFMPVREDWIELERKQFPHS